MTIINYNQAVQYKYKLNDNWKDSDTVRLEGVDVSRDWRFFNSKVEKIQHHVKTKVNPLGVLDYEEVNPVTKGVYRSSEKEFNQEYPTYSRDILATMTRNELIEIAHAYSIDPVRKTDAFLIKLIIDAQIKENVVVDTNE